MKLWAGVLVLHEPLHLENGCLCKGPSAHALSLTSYGILLYHPG